MFNWGMYAPYYEEAKRKEHTDIIEELKSKGYVVKSSLITTYNVYDENNKLIAHNASYEDLEELCGENTKTREWAIKEHRKMWKWISRQIMKDYKEHCSIKKIYSYKELYIENNFKNKYIHNKCFCCGYAREYDFDICYNYCPLYWNAENTEENCIYGYYGSILKIFNNATKNLVTVGSVDEYSTCEEGARRLAKMAYKIAMLEERKDNV